MNAVGIRKNIEVKPKIFRLFKKWLYCGCSGGTQKDSNTNVISKDTFKKIRFYMI